MPSVKKSPVAAAREADIPGLRGIELIFYGQMSLTREADAMLAKTGYGRAHFRALYIVSRHPGITANDLLGRLKISNQSLSRVMKQLLGDGMVVQESDTADRRQRRHSLSPAGSELTQQVLAMQFKILYRAFEAAGAKAVEGFMRVMEELIPPQDRQLLSFPAGSRTRSN